MTRQNLQMMNETLRSYAKKGQIEESRTSGFLIRSGKLVIHFTDKENHTADLCVAYFNANVDSVNLVNKLIRKYVK